MVKYQLYLLPIQSIGVWHERTVGTAVQPA